MDGFAGQSNAVKQSLGDLGDLGLSPDEVVSIYDAMPDAHRDFVNYDAFQAVASDENPSANWDADIIKRTHIFMHQRALNVDQLFRMWNYRTNIRDCCRTRLFPILLS